MRHSTKAIKLILIVMIVFFLWACGGGGGGSSSASNESSSDSTSGDNSSGDSTTNGDSSGDSTTSSDNSSTTSQALTSSWNINNTETAPIIKTSGSATLVNVQSAEATTVSGASYILVKATGVPNYKHTVTQTDLDFLNNRPKKSSDFVSGQTTASLGQVLNFGEDIGYNSNSDCGTGAGFGFWPPGPVCPYSQSHEVYFTQSPEAATSGEECEHGLDTIGLVLNGASFYNWGDGQSYNSQGVWQNLAPIAEVYDVDLCGGHAANGDYHHHHYEDCLAEEFNDSGIGHSPLYGFMADGYPIYGPWHANGTLATSCWKARDYSASSSTGCGTDNKRTCLLANQYDASQGTKTASSAGPDTTSTTTTQSGNTQNTTSGYYFEDYYYDSTCTAQGSQYLDEHNGHDHDSFGYHYHMTTTQNSDGTLAAAFPFIIGPQFYGKIDSVTSGQSNTLGSCGGSSSGGSAPSGGPPSGGPPRTAASR